MEQQVTVTEANDVEQQNREIPPVHPIVHPFFQDDFVTIYHGDCLDILPKLLQPIDLVLTSPPYNLGDVHHRNDRKHRPYSDSMPEPEYQRAQADVLRELHRLAKCVFYNHKNRIVQGQEISPRQWIDTTQWKCRQSLVWINGGPNHDPIRFYPKTERIYWLAKDDSPWLDNRKLWDVQEWVPDRVALNGRGHTRTFPLSLARAILSVAPWAGVVADPFMGSGTTLLAAKLEGRRAIGIERELKYCELAVDRLRQGVLPFVG